MLPSRSFLAGLFLLALLACLCPFVQALIVLPMQALIASTTVSTALAQNTSNATPNATPNASASTDTSAYVRLVNNIHAITRDLEREFAPDKRTALFSVSTSADGKNVKLKGETTSATAKQALLQRLRAASILNVTDSVEVLPQTSLGDKTFGIVTLSVCNLRTKPADAAELTSQGLMGFPVKVLRKQANGWVLVQTADDYIAWVDLYALHIVNASELSAWMSAPKVIVTTESAFTNVAADRTSARVSDVTKGNVLKLLAKIGTAPSAFFHVEYPDGQTAFLAAEHATELAGWLTSIRSFATPASDVIASARLCMGIPYLWGGTSLKGMDCSGFTRTTFMQHGIFLPRDASQQAFVGDSVSLAGGYDGMSASLRAGDLLFFGRKATDKDKEAVTHVGIYIGDGEYIHESGRVRLNSLDAKAKNYNEGRFATLLRARRILNASNKAGIKTMGEIFAK
jgi:gamma-D-glutamyl-L-lysine dipeptidyl-peptidase